MNSFFDQGRMTPKQAVRKMCVQCVQSPFEVENCGGNRMIGTGGNGNNVCFFFPYRLGVGRPSVKIIRKFCLECMGGNNALVRGCATKICPLHPFRLGTNPNRIRATRKTSARQGDEEAICDEI